MSLKYRAPASARVMLAPGDKLPDIPVVVAYGDGRRERVQLTGLLTQGPLVLSFFPLAFTRICTTQMCDARDNAAAYEAAGARVYGFSCDSPHTNSAYARQEGMTHGILSDPNREAVDILWETQTVVGVHRVPKRGWMVVDARGIVVDRYVTDAPGDAWVGSAPLLAAISRALKP